MKNQALFSSKDKSKTLKCRLLQFLFGALRIKQTDADRIMISEQWIHLHPNVYVEHICDRI